MTTVDMAYVRDPRPKQGERVCLEKSQSRTVGKLPKVSIYIPYCGGGVPPLGVPNRNSRLPWSYGDLK